jgi:hypothetical protein
MELFIKYMHMRYHILLFSAFLASTVVFAQNSVNGVAMGQEFKELSAQASIPSYHGNPALQSYASSEVNGSQFFIPGWVNGEVITKRKDVYNSGLQFLYDKVRQQLFVRQKDSSLIVQTNIDEIQSFSLTDEKGQLYNFVNSSLFSNERPEVFYQLLVFDSARLTLLKYTKTNFVKADPTDMMKQREGNVYDAFVDKYTYYLVWQKGPLNPVQLKTKSVEKAFANMHLNPDAYLKEHYQPVDEDFLIAMTKQFNH